MKKPPETVLVGSDLSARSDRAVQRAFMLAREHSAQVILASVIDDAMPEEITKALAAQAEEMLRRSAGFLGRDTSHSVVVRVGHPATEMIALAAEHSPDLVVLGTHRDRSFLAALHETTAQRIVRLTDRSVLVVADPADHPYDQIVAATDFSPGAMTALRAGHRLAPKAKITPVHMLQIPYSGMLGTSSDASRSLEQSFRNDASEANLRWRQDLDLPASDTRFVVGAAYGGLQQAVRETGATLLTVGAHGRVAAPRSLLGSLATDLMRAPITDLLVARP